MALIWKRSYFWPTFHIFKSPGKDTKLPSAHIWITYTCILLTLLTFFALPILQKLQIDLVWFLIGVTPGVDSFLKYHFGAINK